MGDARRAVSAVIAARGHALKRYAFLLCGDDDAADDLVQETVARALGRLRRLPADPHELELYLRRILLNLVVDESRRAARWKRLLPRVSEQTVSGDASEAVCLRFSLGEALTLLPPRQRACIVLHYYADMSVRDVAAELGCEAGTVKAQLHAGRRTLARLVHTDTPQEPVATREGS
ncbi:sigma-70 family RNA polymerase sigma factor [Yinghuangia sp. YIM S09857]|uniref:sigma-70 family RNA polymerase sigma factor n=1 Tax=Yinghuangia sp. YIM S09857 TaxID=3436929 RepID=UPI003F52FFC5